jgi:hypothetical protein
VVISRRQIDKMWFIHILSLPKEEGVNRVTPETITLRETSQTQKDKHVGFHLCEVPKVTKITDTVEWWMCSW